jgi:alpha-tubulin suppressor-like RCC1 family protein
MASIAPFLSALFVAAVAGGCGPRVLTVGYQRPADAGGEGLADVAPDLPPEVGPDVAPEVQPDMTPDVAADARPDACVPATVTQLSLGRSHSCALLATGNVRCWGEGIQGQLGDGTTVTRSPPTTVANLTDAVSIAAGDFHTCAIRRSGELRCWGANGHGQLGDDTTVDRPTPVIIPLPAAAMAVAGGSGHTCVVLDTGGVRCWGQRAYGQLGDGRDGNTWSPGPADVIAGARDVTAAYAHTCALLDSGGVRCWGSNVVGALGLGSDVDSQPMPPPGDLLTGAQAISSASQHTCALLDSGDVRCWGFNSAGQLGDGTINNDGTLRYGLTGVVLSGVKAIAAGFLHSCALLTSGGVRCWGDNLYGELGASTPPPLLATPTGTDVVTGAVAIAAGGSHNCALFAGGRVQCWGINIAGQLGTGSTADYDATPVDVSVLCP